MVIGSRCFHASGPPGSARVPLFLVEYAQTFFSILQPISRFCLYHWNENRPSGNFRLGMPHIRIYFFKDLSSWIQIPFSFWKNIRLWEIPHIRIYFLKDLSSCIQIPFSFWKNKRLWDKSAVCVCSPFVPTYPASLPPGVMLPML